MYEEDTTLQDILGGTVAAGVGGTATAAGIIAERARRLSNSQGIGYRDALSQVGVDIANDAGSAFDVVRGRSPYDDIEKAFNDGVGDKSYPSMREYSEQQSPSNQYSTAVRKKGYVHNPITQAAIAARDAFSPSSEDFLGFRREERLSRGVSPEGPKSDTVFSRIPSLDAVRDLMPVNSPLGFTEDEVAHRRSAGIDLMKGNSAQAAGGLFGRTASDFVNNGARSLWWLLNAPQAVADVAAEGLSGIANREGLYGLDYALESEAVKRGWIDKEGNTKNSSINPVRGYDPSIREKNDPQLQRRVDNLMADGQGGKKLYSRRRVGANLSTLLAAPAAIAINSGLGLNNPFGGSDGRKAVFASEEDPTKTDNVIAEVAAKYILGRQGDLLPWNEYQQVRPDVTQDEYRAYKAYKFNKNADYNIFDDGDINILNGIIKTNDDGIDGAELMFLGRSMPVATTLIPTAAGVGGAALGAALARHGGLNIDGIQEGISRRETQKESFERELDSLSTSVKNESRRKNTQGSIDKLDREIKGKTRMKSAMETGPMRRVFNNPRVRGAGVITAGLLGGFAATGATGLVGNEVERRRREYEAEQGI